MEGPRESAEQFGLIDGLAGPAVLKLGGTVRGEQQKGDAGVIGFRHRREPMGRGRTGGADQCGWFAGPFAQAKGEKSGRSFVKNGNCPESVLVFASQDKGSGTGTGRENDLLNAEFKQSLGHGASPCPIGPGR